MVVLFEDLHSTSSQRSGLGFRIGRLQRLASREGRNEKQHDLLAAVYSGLRDYYEMRV